MAAELTGGLVDPTLVSQLEANGYDRTRRTPELPLAQALASAPKRRPAKAHKDERWRRITITDGGVRRPPGVRFDTGGTGKGLAADLLANELSGRWAIDCGGDLRVSGAFDVEVRHPLTHDTIHTLHVKDGAVATSGIDTRLWNGVDGAPRHHLLDPSTGEPAWTGLISVTALAPTALEAEALAKAALLSGPRDAQKWLKKHGGLLITDDGDVHFV
jgi:thiamine biosynthesis lipoprotein